MGGSARVNPVEECWRRLDQALGNRLCDTLDGLQEVELAAFDETEPQFFMYLCP